MNLFVNYSNTLFYIMNEDNFTIKFVNKNASKRVNEIIEEIKSSFELKNLNIDESPMRCLDMIDNDITLLFKTNYYRELRKEEQNNDQPNTDHVDLNLVPTVPATKIKKDDFFNDKAYGIKKRDIAVESKIEHQRVLRAFQERMIFNSCAEGNQEIMTPFKAAVAQVAKEQTLPIHLLKDNEDNESPSNSTLENELNDKYNEIKNRINMKESLTDNNKEFEIFYNNCSKNG